MRRLRTDRMHKHMGLRAIQSLNAADTAQVMRSIAHINQAASKAGATLSTITVDPALIRSAQAQVDALRQQDRVLDRVIARLDELDAKAIPVTATIRATDLAIAVARGQKPGRRRVPWFVSRMRALGWRPEPPSAAVAAVT